MNTTTARHTVPNNLESCWLPFTANRDFRKNPRLLVSAKGMYYQKPNGDKVLDSTSGLWCVNAGHCRDSIVEAISQQAKTLDYVPAFQFSHSNAFQLASRLCAMAPKGFEQCFFTNSGSEAIDSALKIALAYHRTTGEATRTRLVGRALSYHGVGFGGMSVGGMVNVRMHYGPLLNGVDHLPETYHREKQAFSRGQPAWGACRAQELERIISLHGASNIAAVIVEPVAGSVGVLPPPKGYLEKLREICTAHGILLIFDEVITAFGRLGHGFASARFGVTPDMITFAKGVNNASVPLGGVLIRKGIYEAFQDRPDHAIDLFHGYTYSGHPLATAAALATLDIYEKEQLFEKSLQLEKTFEDAIHSLKGLPLVEDIRSIGLMGAVDLRPVKDAPTKRGYHAMTRAFHDHNLMVRQAGDTIAFSPCLIAEKTHIEEIFSRFATVIKSLSET